MTELQCCRTKKVANQCKSLSFSFLVPANLGRRGRGEVQSKSAKPDCFAEILLEMSADDAKSELAHDKQTECYCQQEFKF